MYKTTYSILSNKKNHTLYDLMTYPVENVCDLYLQNKSVPEICDELNLKNHLAVNYLLRVVAYRNEAKQLYDWFNEFINGYKKPGRNLSNFFEMLYKQKKYTCSYTTFTNQLYVIEALYRTNKLHLIAQKSARKPQEELKPQNNVKYGLVDLPQEPVTVDNVDRILDNTQPNNNNINFEFEEPVFNGESQPYQQEQNQTVNIEAFFANLSILKDNLITAQQLGAKIEMQLKIAF